VTQAASDEVGARGPSLIYIVGRLNQGIGRELRALLRTWELSLQEYTALSVLELRPGLSNAQLARRALVSPQSMIEILAKLESRALVERMVDPEHGRVIRNHLSDDGKRALAAATPGVEALQDRIFGELSDAQRASVAAALTVVMDGLSRKGPARPEPS
jgi:DNA-binding MarR family transcriptional regulator